MSAPMDPSLLAWVQGLAEPAPAPATPRRLTPREGREKTAAWLQKYLCDGDWRDSNEIRTASKKAGILNRWLVDVSQELCEYQHRGLAGGFWRLRREGKGA